jgi:hypothetical protein
MIATTDNASAARPPIVAPTIAFLGTLDLGFWDGTAVFVGCTGVTLSAFVAVVAIEVGTALLDVDAELMKVVELLGATVDVVVALQVLADRFGSWLLSTKYAV